MANWKKKEAGFMVVRPNAASDNYILEKFHNNMERETIELKYSIFNPAYEYQIGKFQNNDEILAAMASYTSNAAPQHQEKIEFPTLVSQEDQWYEYRYAVVKIGTAHGLEEWSVSCTRKELDNVSCPAGYVVRSQIRLNGGNWRGHEELYSLDDWSRIFCNR